MPNLKKFLNLALIIFILVSIPITAFVARQANLSSNASTNNFSIQVTPGSQIIKKGESASFKLDLTFPDATIANKELVLLEFRGLPTGVSLQNQPIGATPSNNYQKVHIFTAQASNTIKEGEYEVRVISSTLKRTQSTAFKIVVK